MSIYSGFATRQQQQAYDGLLVDLIDVLQRRIVKFYTSQQADEHKFHLILTNIYTHLAKMQESKYLQPKLSQTFKPLLALTATVNDTYLDLQKHLARENHQNHLENEGNPQNGPAAKESLSFSRDKCSQESKAWSFGKIKHQQFFKDEPTQREQTNPEDGFVLDKKVKRAVSTHFPKNFRSRRQYVRRGGADSYSKQGLPQDAIRRDAHEMIREYVSKSFNRRTRKRMIVD